jgi:hypothetical protein
VKIAAFSLPFTFLLGGPCSMHGSNQKYLQDFGQKTLKQKPFERLWHKWGIILNWILKVYGKNV